MKQTTGTAQAMVTQANQSLNSVSQNISLKSSTANLNASGSMGTSGVFKSPGKKPPMMAKSHQKFFAGPILEEKAPNNVKDDLERLQ